MARSRPHDPYSRPDRWGTGLVTRALGRLPWIVSIVAACVVGVGCGGKKNPVVPTPIPPLDSIRVMPDTLDVRVGQNRAFSVVGWDTLGVLVSGVPATFSSEDTLALLFSIDAAGGVHGKSEGIARVFAVFGSLRDTAVVRVLPPQDGWYAQTSNTSNALRGVFFMPDGRTGWAVGDNGRIVRTEDAGEHWTTLTSGVTLDLRSVWFVSELRGWAVGVTGAVLRTNNGGDTWARQTSNASETLEDVCFVNDSTGIVVGATGVVLTTDDRGLTWTRRVVTTSPSFNSVSFAGPLNGWAVAENGAIAGTHDGGASWFVTLPPVTAQALRGVWRRSESAAFAVGEQGVAPRTFVRTTLPDTTAWELRTTGAANQLEGVHFPTDLTGYAVGQNANGLVLRTDDGGTNWRTQTSNTQFRLYDVFFVDDHRGWAVGANGTILHTSTGGE